VVATVDFDTDSDPDTDWDESNTHAIPPLPDSRQADRKPCFSGRAERCAAPLSVAVAPLPHLYHNEHITRGDVPRPTAKLGWGDDALWGIGTAHRRHVA